MYKLLRKLRTQGCRLIGAFSCRAGQCYMVLRTLPLNYSFYIKSHTYPVVIQCFITKKTLAKSNFLEQHSCMLHIHECSSSLRVFPDKLNSCIGSYTNANFQEGYTKDHNFANFHRITFISIPVDAPSKIIHEYVKKRFSKKCRIHECCSEATNWNSLQHNSYKGKQI